MTTPARLKSRPTSDDTESAKAANHERSNLRRDMSWYRKHRRSLLRRYRGQYVAIVDAAVVDHGRDFSALARRVFGRFGNREIYMPRVESGDRVVRVRSPRLRR